MLKKLDTLKNLSYIDDEIFNLVSQSCIFHDYGKVNKRFQNRIKNGGKFDEKLEVAHNILSVYFLDKTKYAEEDYYIIFNSILNHHDYCDNIKVIEENTDLINELLDDFNTYDIRVSRVIRKCNELIEEKKMIVTKGLLHKCDYSASGEYEIEYKNDFLIEILRNWQENSNIKLNELQRFCAKNTDKNIIAIAQTGMGKTEGGLMWIGDNKGFFVLPLKTAINAIYARVLDLLDNKDFDNKVALLHSDILSKYIKLNMDNDISSYITESKKLSIPLTITTLDQIFDFVFRYNGYELKLATLSYSKIVIDEIQMYSPDLLAFLIYAIELITKVGGKFAILTATMPPFIYDFMEKNIEMLSYSRGTFYNEDIRHNVKVIDDEMTSECVYDFYIKQDCNCKLIVICNTIKKAQEIYVKLNEYGISKSEINIFHSKYIRKDRSELEKKILNFGKTENKATGIWITTQVVEASLDIDFDYLITELSDINGLFQRFGRCNRKGLKNITEYNCFVYLKINPKLLCVDGTSGFIDKTIHDISKNILLMHDGQLSEATKIKLIEENFTYDKLKDSYFIKKLKCEYSYIKESPVYEIDKSEVLKRFRNIISYKVIPENVYNENKSEIEENISIFLSGKSLFKDKVIAMDKIIDYTVSVGKYDFNYNCICNQIKIGRENIPIVKCEYNEIGYKKIIENKVYIVDNFL